MQGALSRAVRTGYSYGVVEYQRVCIFGGRSKTGGTNGDLLDFRRHSCEDFIAGDAVVLITWVVEDRM